MVDRRWFSGRRLLIGIGIAILASVLLVWAWWTAPHRDLAVALDGVQPPAGLLYLGEERQGDRMCFFDNCPRLTRYYGSALEPDELCLVVEEEFPGLDEVDVSPLGRRGLHLLDQGSSRWLWSVLECQRAHLRNTPGERE